MSDQNFFSLAAEHYQSGRLDAAEAAVRSLLKLQPKLPEALVLAAYISAGKGDEKSAADWLAKAEAVQPGPEVLLARARIQISFGQHESAWGTAEKLAKAAPEDPDYPGQLAQDFLKANRSDLALPLFSAAAKLGRLSIVHRRNYALALADCGMEVEALKEWKRLAKLWPEDLNILLNAAKLMAAHGDFKSAIPLAQNAAALNPNFAPAHLLTALALAEDGRSEEASAPIKKAIELEPNNPIALAALGFWQQENGEFEEARQNLESAIELNPTHGFAYYNLFRAKKATESDLDRLEQIEKLSRTPGLSLRDRGYMNYALGKANEDLKNFEAAMRFYVEGNDCAYAEWLAKEPWDKAAYSAGFDKTIETFGEQRLAELSAKANESQTPILIVGMIRSGTSLLEQILSSHPDITGAGELPFWHENESRAFIDGEPSAESLSQLADEYLLKLNQLSKNGRRVTDKLPHNYAMLALIHAAMPKAKIIHVKRSPRDNALSVFTTAYQRPPVFAHNRGNIVYAYREYQRLMEHWRSVISQETLLEVRYEDLVLDREGMTKKIIDFCDLEWSEKCLEHTENKRSVRTPSLWQVRQPIYTTSMARWKRFEPWLGELAELEG